MDLLNSNEFNFANMLRSFARKLFLYGLVSKVGNIDFNNGKLINANVEKLPLDNNSFDLISSVAAFEHFLSLDKVLAECDRVLRPGGHIWVAIHLYTAPSGAHNISFTQVPLTKMPRNVDPWDHLRKKKLPINIVLNKMRMADYEKVFAKYFDIKKQYCYLREGEQWYDEAVAKEIGSEYTEDELTCGTLVILAKSKK